MIKTKSKNHPLDLWQSPKVLSLLIDFYTANFLKAGLAGADAEKFIKHAWDNRQAENKNKIRRECDKILLQAKEGLKLNFDPFEAFDLFDLSQVDCFLDIGANKLNAVNYFAKKYEQIKQFIAVDVVPQSKPFFNLAKSQYFQIDSDAKNWPIKNQSVDFINIQYVLHHFTDLESIKNILAICAKTIKPNGRLVLWEETFADQLNLNELIARNQKIKINTDLELTKRFYDLGQDQRWEFIIINDWLINVSNSHMPWTGQYYTWPEWVALLKDCGFELEKEYNLGLRISGRLKQGVQIIGEFRRV